MRYVEVVWSDAHDASEGWIAAEDIHVGCKVTTVGVLERSTPDYYVIAGSVTEHGDLGHVLSIPRKTVHTLRTLT